MDFWLPASGGGYRKRNEFADGGRQSGAGETLKDAMSLYYKTFQKGRINIQSAWIDKMIHCVEKSAYFNTQRMIQQYNEMMWHM